MKRASVLGVLFAVTLTLSIIPVGPTAQAAPSSDFTSASSSIGTAFLAVSRAQQDGGNVTGLVASLNLALGFYARAQGENGSSPAQASVDLQNATAIAQQVALAAPAVGRAGAAARQVQVETSVAAAVAIVAIAVGLYFFGERIYHRLWLRVYSGYVVKKVG